MDLLTAPAGDRLLLIYRSDTLFYTPERRRLAEEWNQVRFTSETLPPTGALDHSLDRPLPLPASSFDAIYAFHVIEHLDLPQNRQFMADIHRLLKPGGVYRASTPDLEYFAIEYLERLNDQARADSVANYARYHWSVCNLIDQCVRDVSGGEMSRAVNSGNYDRDYVKKVHGDSLEVMFAPPRPWQPPPPQARGPLTPARILRGMVRRVRERFFPQAPQPRSLEKMHEKNLWLFDRVSLPRLFSEAGLNDISVVDHRTSSIPTWARYNFDQSAYGEYPLEPSLYVEGVKGT